MLIISFLSRLYIYLVGKAIKSVHDPNTDRKRCYILNIALMNILFLLHEQIQILISCSVAEDDSYLLMQ